MIRVQERLRAAHGSLESRVWKLVAYLGRYGHQPANVCLRLPVPSLMRLADEVEELLKQEAPKRPGGGDV